ncbi:MAG: SDR family NAD(P)-dependent oxidoreductase [Clostridia bacterium]|nr:SDR family NAD(P)-dependent oxidoreductase [Clostridia bacterium]
MEKQEENGKNELRSAKKTAVVVGGSSGIGKCAALRLCARGYRVFNVSRTPFQGERVRTITADVAQEGELTAALTAIGKEVEAIDFLIYSAGISFVAPLEYAKSGDYRYLFEVNYFGAIEAIRAAAPFMKARGGKIILIGSLGGEIPIPYDGFYSASKAALSMLAREADLELRPRGISVTALLPGGTATDFTYNRKIYGDEESRVYATGVRKASAALANMEQGGMNPSLVAEALVRICEGKNPPVVRVVGKKNAALFALRRVLPERVTGFFVRRKFNQGK